MDTINREMLLGDIEFKVNYFKLWAQKGLLIQFSHYEINFHSIN